MNTSIGCKLCCCCACCRLWSPPQHCRSIMAQALCSAVHLIATENALPMITSFAQALFCCHLLTTQKSIQSNIYFHTFDLWPHNLGTWNLFQICVSNKKPGQDYMYKPFLKHISTCTSKWASRYHHEMFVNLWDAPAALAVQHVPVYVMPDKLDFWKWGFDSWTHL